MKKLWIIVFLVLVMATVGCAGSQKKLTKSDQNEERIIALEQKTESLRGDVEQISQNLAKLSDNLEVLLERTDAIQRALEEPSDIQSDTERISERLALIDEKLKGLEKRESYALTIKVLSGDGNIDSANDMARKLEAKGYVVKNIDFAPSASFSRHTVFYNKELKTTARELISTVGINAQLKPLSWTTVYDIIVVTGGAQ
ncbi:LytR C-terminal domain-containing protein [Nitrospirota bacterium]